MEINLNTLGFKFENNRLIYTPAHLDWFHEKDLLAFESTLQNRYQFLSEVLLNHLIDLELFSIDKVDFGYVIRAARHDIRVYCISIKRTKLLNKVVHVLMIDGHICAKFKKETLIIGTHIYKPVRDHYLIFVGNQIRHSS